MTCCVPCVATFVSLLQLDVSGAATTGALVEAVVTAVAGAAEGADEPLLNMFEKKPETLPGIFETV